MKIIRDEEICDMRLGNTIKATKEQYKDADFNTCWRRYEIWRTKVILSILMLFVTGALVIAVERNCGTSWAYIPLAFEALFVLPLSIRTATKATLMWTIACDKAKEEGRNIKLF